MNTQQTQPSRANNWVIQASVGVLVVIIFVGIVFYAKRDKTEVTETVTNTQVNSELAPVAPATLPAENIQSSYADGTYSATGSYVSPGGREQVAVTLTLANGVVTASELTPTASSPTSELYQKEFASNYKQYVIGKSISSLKLTKVAGSSLTPKGFNDALEQIKTKAQS